MRTTAKHSIQRALGLKRTMWQKVLPFVSVIISYVPAIVFVGLAALIPADERPDDLLPTYAEYYGFVIAAIFIFAAFVAPEVLCTDRRTGMLGLYLASPLDRNTYLLAKAAAVGLVLSIVTVGPLLFMLVANTIVGSGPDGPGDWIVALVRILTGGLAVSVVYASLSLAVASFTSRRAAASAAIIVLLVGSGFVAASLVFDAGWSNSLLLFDLLQLPLFLVFRVFGETWGGHEQEVDSLSTGLIVAANIGWTALFSAIVWYRYRKITVTR
jgi:ABC-2 type transport system permease protein